MEVLQQAHGKAGLLGVLLLVGDGVEARVTCVLLKRVMTTKAPFKCTASGAHHHLSLQRLASYFYLPIYHFPAFQSSSLPIFLSSCLPHYLPVHFPLSSCLPFFLPSCLSLCLPSCVLLPSIESLNQSLRCVADSHVADLSLIWVCYLGGSRVCSV